MRVVRWNDFFGGENLLVEGKDDDVFHIRPDQRDDEGNKYVSVLSKKAIIEIAAKLNKY